MPRYTTPFKKLHFSTRQCTVYYIKYSLLTGSIADITPPGPHSTPHFTAIKWDKVVAAGAAGEHHALVLYLRLIFKLFSLKSFQLGASLCEGPHSRAFPLKPFNLKIGSLPFEVILIEINYSSQVFTYFSK